MAIPGTENESARRRVPKQARAQERVVRILDAARAELQARTPGEIRTEDIAERAGVPVGSLYQYFPSKAALLAAVAESVVAEADRVVARQLTACLEMDWRDAVDVVLDGTFDFYRSSTTYVKLLRSIRHTGEFAAITTASNDRLADLFALHPAFAKAGVPQHRAATICRVLVTAFNALQDRVLAEDELDFERWREETRTLVKSYLAVYAP